jgi:hypothetical protein
VATKPTRVDRTARWRNYVDLSPVEKTAVRRMFAQGHAIMAIAHHFRVYPGTVTTAAERGRWRRPGGVETVGQRVAAALARHPTLPDQEIAKLVSCDPSYVHTIRHWLRAKKNTPAK